MKMKAVILAGGLGARLRPLTFAIPKPLIPIGEKPILENIIFHLKSHGFTKFIFAIGYRGDLIETYFKDGSEYGVKISYFREDSPLGTAGPLSCIDKVFPFEKEETFLLMNGDILSKLDMKKFARYHQNNGSALTVGVKKFQQQLPFGVLKIQDGQVEDVTEKPVNQIDISAGVYLMNRSVVEEIPYKEFFTMPELIKKLLLRGKKVGAYFIDEYWHAVENLKDVEQAMADIDKWTNR
ncbi:MAG: sugar phosphate nucleotidyltransferase [Planctomycetota bacterium]|jgi:NDP-sugar pyrophosphorylase family protein